MKTIHILSVMVLMLVADGWTRTYSTQFPLTENPISESNAWINGAKTGIDWGDVSTTPGQTHPHPGPARYADATALLTGTWGPDQSAQGTVYITNAYNYPEVEIRLRSSLSAHVCNGYEITWSIAPNSYLLIVRWNGPLGNYTVLSNPSGSQYQVKTGDVVKATISGNVITAYKNGAVVGTATDNTYTTGLPGMGFNEQPNGDYGYTSFSATDGITEVLDNYPKSSSQGTLPRCVISPRSGDRGLVIQFPGLQGNVGAMVLRILDLFGNEVKRLDQPCAGRIEWDGSNESADPAPAGLYIVKYLGRDLRGSQRVSLTR